MLLMSNIKTVDFYFSSSTYSNFSNLSVEENGRTGRLNSTGASVNSDAVNLEAARSVRARMDDNVVLAERAINPAMGAVGDDSMSSNDSVDNMLNLLAPADSSVSDSLLESDIKNKKDGR